MSAKKLHRACDNKIRVDIFARLDAGTAAQHVLLGFDESSHDDKLLVLTKGLGLLARGVELKSRSFQNEELERLLAYTFGWLMRLGEKMPFNKIHDERERQDALFVEGKIPFNCASRIADAKRKLRVLVEEVGEVAQEIDNLEQHPDYKALKANLKTELTQVAAVCVAWLESLEAKKP